MEPNINPDNKEFNWQVFLNENETLLGIETFVNNLLQTVSAEELIRNTFQFKPHLILNEILLKVVLTTQHKQNRITVYLLLQIVSKNVTLYDELSNKVHFWKTIYHFFYPYSNLLNNKKDMNEIELSKLIMQKLSVMHQFHVRCEQDTNYVNLFSLTGNMISNENKRSFSVGTLLIDHDIKRICISENAILILNENKEVIEYFLSDETEDINIIHQNSKIIHSNVKEMLNFETVEVGKDQYGTHESQDNCVAILTYSGELFFHKVIYNISYTVKFNSEFMKNNYGFDNFKVLNIQCCNDTSAEIAFELENHSIYVMNVRILFSLIEENVNVLSEEYGKYFDQEAVSSTSLSGYIPNKYFYAENTDGYTLITMTNEKEFDEEKGLSFEQKIHRKSPRIFTVYSKDPHKTFAFYFDNVFKCDVTSSHLKTSSFSSGKIFPEEKDDVSKEISREEKDKNVSPENKDKTLYVSINKQSIDDNNNYIQITHLYEIPEMNFKLQSRKIQQLSVISLNGRIIGENLNMLYESYLQIKCDDVFYWMNIEKCKSFAMTILNGVMAPAELNVDGPIYQQREIISDEKFINDIKQSELIELKLPDKLNFKEIFYSSKVSSLFALTSDGRLLINPGRISTPMVMNLDGGYGDIDIICHNISKIICHNHNLNRDDMILRIKGNEYVFVPEEYYMLYNEENRIEREIRSGEDIISPEGNNVTPTWNSIIFNLYNSPYNFRVDR